MIFCIKESLLYLGNKLLLPIAAVWETGGGQFQTKNQPALGYRCLHQSFVTVCTIPVERRGHLEVLITRGNWFLLQTSYVILCVCI